MKLVGSPSAYNALCTAALLVSSSYFFDQPPTLVQSLVLVKHVADVASSITRVRPSIGSSKYESQPFLFHKRTPQRKRTSSLCNFPISSSIATQQQGNNITSTIPSDWRLQVLNKLSIIIDPDLNTDIVTLQFIKNLNLDETSRTLSFDIELTTPACPIKDTFQSQALDLVTSLPFVSNATITMTSRPQSQNNQQQGGLGGGGLSNVRNIIAISSCKGGVGKSTVAVNLAYTLKNLGARVGIFDADVYGPSLPTMVIPNDDAVRFVGRQISPLTYEGVKLMSFGYVNDGAAIMRGPMVDQLLNQLLTVVHWGELDYLILDMPPGTGDIQLTLSQRMNITAAVIVTTPQELSYVDVARGIDMFGTVEVPCVAVVENMAYYVPDKTNQEVQRSSNNIKVERLKTIISDRLSKQGIENKDLVADIVQLVAKEMEYHNKDNNQDQEVRIFGPGHLSRLSNQFGIEHTFAIPLMTDIATSGDAGIPFVLRKPNSVQSGIFKDLASSVVREIAKLQYNQNSSSSIKLEFEVEEHLLKVYPSSSSEGKEFGVLKPATLRRDCKCASCVEEMTGRQILQPQSVSEMIKPTSIQPCGNYALSVTWSDGHRSLYPYRQIRSLLTSEEMERPSLQVEKDKVIV
jgi:Mrp family chromosome partitioning ATPase/DUF971 family protein